MKRITLMLLLTVPLAASAFAPLAAQAQEGVFMKNLLGEWGLIDDGRKDGIDYRERAPLVLPPKMELRQPLPTGSVASRNPSWPDDPEVAARREAARDARIPQTEREKHRLNNRPELSASEIRAGRRAGAGLTNEPRYAEPDNTRDLQFIDASKMRDQDAIIARNLASSENVNLNPERRELTDPPGQYRKIVGQRSKAAATPIEHKTDDDANARSFIDQITRR